MANYMNQNLEQPLEQHNNAYIGNFFVDKDNKEVISNHNSINISSHYYIDTDKEDEINIYNIPKSPSDPNYYTINIEDIINGKDKRTTIMIRNIPNKYKAQSFREEINKFFFHTYDIFYLPIDYVKRSNLGYCFINFLNPLYIILFYDLYFRKKWENYNGDKICDLSYAKYQGREELIQHYSKGKTLTEKDKEKRPLILDIPEKLPDVFFPIKYLKYFAFLSYKIKVLKDDNNIITKKVFTIENI